MATFVLVPGAGGVAWYWHRVVPLLKEAGHDAIAVDLPGDDKQAGLSAYADRVVEAIGGRHVILVAQSLGGFTAPLVCARVRVRMLVFVNAMIPIPGETAGEWWDNTGSTAARTEAAQRSGYSTKFDLATYFLHDVPPEVIQQGEGHQRPEAEVVFAEPCRFEAWPEVPIHVIAGRDDRFFPIDFQRRVARERLHQTVDELAGGHLVALSNPGSLVNQLVGYLRSESCPARARGDGAAGPHGRAAPCDSGGQATLTAPSSREARRRRPADPSRSQSSRRQELPSAR